jgi:hypothetical protein
MMGYSIPSISQSFVRKIRLDIKFLLYVSNFVCEITMLSVDFQAVISILWNRSEMTKFFLTKLHYWTFIMNKETLVKMEAWKISPKVSNGQKAYSQDDITLGKLIVEMGNIGLGVRDGFERDHSRCL